jgi:hypothetical protein
MILEKTGQAAQFMPTEDRNLIYKYSKQVSSLPQDSVFVCLIYDCSHTIASATRVYKASSIYGQRSGFVLVVRQMNTAQPIDAAK